MVAEARLDRTDVGLVPQDDGWFVLNAKDARWYHAEGRSALCDFEGESEFAKLGVRLYVLARGESMGMYHWEANQEDFLVLSGEGVLLVEEEERPLRAWDFVHCPPHVNHMIIGTGDSPFAVLAVGAREVRGAGWGGYPMSDLARRHGVGVETETNDVEVAYADVTRRGPTRYRDGWLA